MSNASMQSTVGIRPGVGMLGLLSAMNYKPWYALSEFVDNAVASYTMNADALRRTGAQRLVVSVEFDRALGEIVITDNAAGIAVGDIARAFKSAEPPLDATGLSQFGIGMKAAACWYSRSFTVTSTALGEDVRRRVTFDVPAIVEANQESLPVITESAPSEQHGTQLVLKHLHRPLPQGATLGKVRRYLGSIYRGFLGPDFLLTVAGEAVTFTPPALLTHPRWDAPTAGATPLEWRKDVEVSLPDGRTITGWAGLRAKGSTKQAGLALVFRGKVVVGAGSAAGEAEDLYRPAAIFGSGNSFVSQRLVGELDVSALRVTHSKDAILWDGNEELVLAALRSQLDCEPLPLLRMANLHRVNERGPDISTQVRDAVRTTASAAQEIALPTHAPEDHALPEDEVGGASLSVRNTDPAVQAEPDDVVTEPFNITVGSDGLSVRFSVSESPDAAWIRLTEEPSGHHIRISRDHPFMRSFAHLPNQEIEPVLRLAVALGVAEIAARRAGAGGAGQVRAQLNVALRGPLGKNRLTDLNENAS